jgi:hypothetical protein
MAAKPEKGESVGVLYGALRRKLDPKTIESIARALENRDAEETDATTAAFQIIDTKAAGLLTHVSMMIAGLGICAPLLAQHWIEETVIVVEISVYLLIAVGCLRCLSVVRSLQSHKEGDEVKHRVQRELIIRHELYRVCNRLSIYFTILVFISLPLMLWWKPV